MALQRAYFKKIMLSLFDKEATYNAGPAGWSATSACQMEDYTDSASYEEWDDTVQGNNDLITGFEFMTHQELVRQSMRFTYTEPRTKPNTLAGMIALSLGTVATTQDGALTAYRHKITPAGSTSLPSIACQTLRDGGVQRMYTGVKGDGFQLNENGPYFNFQSTFIGSGTRTTAADAFVPAISENWLRWGDAHIYLKDTAGTPITIPASPSQSAANLGGSEVDFSTKVLTYNLQWMNNLATDMGYRASTGMVRQNFHSTRRRGTLGLKFELDSTTEAADLDRYLNQTKMAIELRINSGTIIAATGVFQYGATFIIPRAQLMPPTRSQTSEFENLEYMFEIMDDMTNPALNCWVYNARPTYLA